MSKRIYNSLNAFMDEHKKSFNEKLFLEKLSELANDNDPTKRTISTRYSRIKSYVRDNYPDIKEETLKKIKPADELTKKIIQENQERRNDKKLVEFDKDLVDKFLSLKDSESPYERAIFYQFVSGRRINEIFDGEIGRQGKNPRIVKMKLSKQSMDSEDKMQDFLLLKDSGITNKQFKSGVQNLRKAIHSMTLGDFTLRVNRTVKKIRKDLTSHSLRGLYGVYMFNTDNTENQIETGYISKVLNHKNGSDQGINYSQYVYKEKGDKAKDDDKDEEDEEE